MSWFHLSRTGLIVKWPMIRKTDLMNNVKRCSSPKASVWTDGQMCETNSRNQMRRHRPQSGAARGHFTRVTSWSGSNSTWVGMSDFIWPLSLSVEDGCSVSMLICDQMWPDVASSKATNLVSAVPFTDRVGRYVVLRSVSALYWFIWSFKIMQFALC